MKVKKSTKKFIKTKLKNELEHRKKRKEKSKFVSKKSQPEPEPQVEEESSDEEVTQGFIGDVAESDSSLSEDSEMEQEEDFSDESSVLEDEDAMQRELEKLQESDPKFYEYLKENDAQLLEFNAESDDNSDVEMEQEDVQQEVSKETIHKLRTAISTRNSIKAWVQLLKYVKEATEFEENISQVFNLVILTAMKYSGQVLNHHLHERKPQESKKWKRLRQKVKLFLTSIGKLLNILTSGSMKRYIIKQSEQLIHYFNCFPKITRVYVKQLVELWATSDDDQVRILSFFFLRKLALEHPNPYLNIVFKTSFGAFMETCRQTTIHNYTQLTFMSNSLVELGGISLDATYTHTFVYLRELAVKLRQATSTRTKEAFKLIYNWQFLHAVKFWASLLCTYCGNEQIEKDQEVLKPLIYPLVQIMIGVLRLKPSSKHFPLRLAIVRLMIDISKKTRVFIPVTAYLMDIFESNGMTRKPKPSTLKPLDFKLNIRAPNNYLGTRTYYTGLLEEVIHLLYEYFSSHALSIAFPELVVPTVIQLRKMCKNSSDFAKNKQIQQLVEKLEQNAKFIEQKRSQVSFGPKDLQESLDFLADIDPALAPLYKYNETRLKVIEKLAPREMMVAEGDNTDSEDEQPQQPKQKSSKKTKMEVDGDDDVVEDFELSDEE